jgi:hypothetical protein
MAFSKEVDGDGMGEAIGIGSLKKSPAIGLSFSNDGSFCQSVSVNGSI